VNPQIEKMSHSHISQRVSSLRPTAVNAILTEVRELKMRGKDVVSLMRGEPDIPTPEHIVAAASESLANGRTTYPNNQGEPLLREAVAKKLSEFCIGDYSADDEILITTGATFGVYAALAAVLDPDDEVLLPEPVYDAYLGVISLLGGIAKSVPARIEQGHYTLDSDALQAACSPKSKVLLLNTPWNPTGTVLTEDELSALMSVAAKHDLVVLSDEIYEAVIYEERNHVSPAAISDDARHRTILVNSFSKTYAMTGWRLGYCAASAEYIRGMSLVLQQSSRGPSTFVQDAGVAALTGPQKCVAEMREEYAKRRQQVCEALSGLSKVRVVPPEAGFFVMVDVRELGIGSDEIRKRLLNEFGVVVVHGSAYGASAEGTLRISFASGGENLREGLKRLRQGLSVLSGDNAREQ
jgi:aspartate/methionine/tyrosine aminotransferase